MKWRSARRGLRWGRERFFATQPDEPPQHTATRSGLTVRALGGTKRQSNAALRPRASGVNSRKRCAICAPHSRDAASLTKCNRESDRSAKRRDARERGSVHEKSFPGAKRKGRVPRANARAGSPSTAKRPNPVEALAIQFNSCFFYSQGTVWPSDRAILVETSAPSSPSNEKALLA